MSLNKIISFEQLYYTDFDIENVFAMRQKWIKGAVFNMSQPRKSTGIILLKNCCASYVCKSKKVLEINKKALVCLPQGCEYKCINRECTGTLDDAVLIEFNARKDNSEITFSSEPFVINDINILLAEKYFADVIDSYEKANISPLQLKSALYNLLSFICREKNTESEKRFFPIRNGIEFLEKDMLCDFSIEEIANACNISSSYFRRLFKEYSGKSPHEYRLDARLNMAKNMLKSSDATLEYIAETLNFQSPSYFCRIFKKKFGVTPGNYRAE